jgi:hypothetical protein
MKTRYSQTTGTFYPLDIEYPQLPVDIQEVALADYEAAMARPAGHSFAFVDGALVISPPPAPTLDELKAAKNAEINAECERRIQAVINTYPGTEVLTFDKQEKEARAWLADSATATPLLDALAAYRGIAKDDLVNRIIAKADYFADYSGAHIGHRQKLEDQVSAATTHADLDLIDPMAGWPA